MIKKLLFTFFLVFIQFVSFSQSTGDYRSKVANGNWNDVASWEYYNGSNWVPATSYPGEAVGTGTVTILNGDNITLNANITNSFAALVIGESATATSTSFGIFSVGGDFQLNTPDVVINKYAVLQFTDNKGSLYLPEGAGMLIDPLGGLATPGGPGNCNNNINIFIGTIEFGVCTGGGAIFTFDQLNNAGGTLYAKPTSNSPICSGSTIQLTGNASNPNPAVTVSYSWSIEPPTGAVFTSSLQNPTISNAQNGIYKATLTCSATYSGVLYSNSETIFVTVNPLPTTPTISTCCPTTFCAGGSVTLTSSTASGYQWYNGGVAISGETGITYIATTSGTYTVITNNGTCSSLASAGTPVTVISLPATPTLSGAIQATCTTDGSFTITNYDATYTYTFTPSAGVIQSGATVNAPAGSYTVRATLGACSSTVSSPIEILGSSTATWSGTSWSPSAPTINDVVIINGNYTMDGTNGNISACRLTINSPAILTVSDTYFLTIQNHLTVNTGATLEIKNQGSLVMINDAGNVINNGTINVNKTTAPFEKYDYTYWSSPLKVTTSIATTFPTWRRAYEYHPENYLDLVTAKTGVAVADGFDDDGNDWIRISTMTTPGKGCIIMGPTTGSFPRTESVVFRGTVNNGVVSVPVLLSPGTVDAGDDFNLVGNPYPSAISADKFILANINTGGTINQTISGTLLFWTHMDDASITNPGPEAYNYSADDYAMYNLSGGVGTAGSVSGSAPPSGYIASGQGFFVEAVGAGAVTFNNSMRVGDLPNTQFFKTQSVKDKANAVNKDRFWLNLQNTNGMFSQQLVGYFENATMGYDNGYDGLLSNAGNFVNFYSFIDDAAYKIQGREAFNADDQIRLGYFSSIAGTFNINIDSKEGVFSADETPIYLEDKALGIIHDLKQSAYSFETEKGSFDDRFVLRYNNTDKTLGTDESKISENKIIVSVKERQLKINSFEEAIDKVWIYDLLGRQIFTKEKVDSSEFVISNLVSAKQTLIVKVLLQNGQIYTDKVVY